MVVDALHNLLLRNVDESASLLDANIKVRDEMMSSSVMFAVV